MCLKRFFAAGSVIALACLGVSADNLWGPPYHWEISSTSAGVVLDVGRNFSNDWNQYFNTALSDWNQSAVLSLTGVPGKAKRNCRGSSGRIEVCADSYGFNLWLGLAQISVDGPHITKAVAKLNRSYLGPGSGTSYDTPEWRQAVTCQEIGHDFGLSHIDEDFNTSFGSCMDYSNDIANNQHPSEHDKDMLQFEIYDHEHVASGGNGGPGNGNGNGRGRRSVPPPAMEQIDLATPAQWGELVSTSANGLGRTYEVDFGGGHRVITHVRWANPALVGR